MPSRRIDDSVIENIIQDLKDGKTRDFIVTKYHVGNSTVDRLRRQNLIPVPKHVLPPVAEPPEPDLHAKLRKFITKTPRDIAEIADHLDCGPSRVRETLEKLKNSGAMIAELHGKFTFAESIHLEPGKIILPSAAGVRVFGAISDNHLCNKHSRLDVLNAAYDEYERRGITEVFNGGNWVDGEARFNKTELVTAPGMDNQLDYMIDKYPHKKGITTHYIAGDDHEGWYQQREGIEVGRYLQHRAEDAGRHDLKYLGYGEADVKLQYGTGEAVMRVVHPGGGSSYAISYTDQKRVESYQGGEKPQIELAAHYHKANYGYPREVHTVQTGCTCDQTMFMRKKRLQAHVGFWIITITQREDGSVGRFGTEWFPYFDRGYYEKRF